MSSSAPGPRPPSPSSSQERRHGLEPAGERAAGGKVVSSRFMADAQAKAAAAARLKKETASLKAKGKDVLVPDPFPGGGYSVPSRYLSSSSALPSVKADNAPRRAASQPKSAASGTAPTRNDVCARLPHASSSSVARRPPVVATASLRTSERTRSFKEGQARAPSTRVTTSAIGASTSAAAGPAPPALVASAPAPEAVGTAAPAPSAASGPAVKEETQTDGLQREIRLLDALAQDDTLLSLVKEARSLTREVKAAVDSAEEAAPLDCLPGLTKLLRQTETSSCALATLASQSPNASLAPLARAYKADVDGLQAGLQRAIKRAKARRDVDCREGEKGA